MSEAGDRIVYVCGCADSLVMGKTKAWPSDCDGQFCPMCGFSIEPVNIDRLLRENAELRRVAKAAARAAGFGYCPLCVDGIGGLRAALADSKGE
jgi:hypothetical protein